MTVISQTLRQEQTNGVCPSQKDTFCPELCCPGRCCTTAEPFCLSTDESTTPFCVDADGKHTCTSGKLGTPCVAALEKEVIACCPVAPFDRCTADEPFACVTEQGYIGCGADNQPGVACPDGGCCEDPERCYDGGCRSDGEGGPRNVEALIAPKPASTPLPAGSSQSVAEGSACFPADATVRLEDGSLKTMEELDTGDRVRVSQSGFSEVFMWTHRDTKLQGKSYVELVSREGHRLVAAVGHLLYMCRGAVEGCVRETVQVEKVRAGDGVVVVANGSERVVQVRETKRIVSRGLYNPQTLHGDIVVDGVLSTCYTKFVPIRAAHGLLALRGFYSLFELVSRIGERRWWTRRI